VASAPITSAFNFFPNSCNFPNRKATGAFVKTICAPSATHLSATFQVFYSKNICLIFVGANMGKMIG